MTYDTRHLGCLARRLALLVLGAGLGLSAFGQALPTPAQAGVQSLFSAATRLTTATATAANGYWVPSVDGAGFRVGVTTAVAGPYGKATNAAAFASVSGSAARTFAARALALAPPVALAITLYSVYDAYRVKPDGNGGLLFDPGQQGVPGTGYDWFDPGDGFTIRYSSLSAAMNVQLKRLGQNGTCRVLNSDGSTGTRSYHFYSTPAFPGGTNPPGYWDWYAYCGDGTPPGDGSETVRSFRSDPKTVDTCTSGAMGPDGLCPSGNFQPISPEAAGDKVAPVAPGDFLPALDDALNTGLDLPLPAGLQGFDTSIPLSPASLEGPVSTVSGPNGNRESTVSSTGEVVPGRAEIKWPETTVTTGTDANGNPIPTETTTESGDPEPEPDPCEADPKRLGCIKLGEAPGDVVPKKTVNVDYAAESVSLGSGCPGNVALARGYSFDFTPTCNGVSLMRPVFIACAAFAAALIVIGALRGTS